MPKLLETKRLLLREFTPGDARDLFRLNSDPEVVRFTGDPPFESVEEARFFIESYKDYREHGMGRWAVIEKGSGRFLGWCGLKAQPEGYVDIGYRFFRSEWGKGYATEAAQACLEHGFGKLGLQELIGRVAPGNKASIRVLEKLGMTYWKQAECESILDALYYRVSREEAGFNASSLSR